MHRTVSEETAWRLVALLSVISAGAYVGHEAAVYFWDVTGYVGALDTEFPYRFMEPYPFLYPPAAKHIFTLARSHLFEFLSIALVAAVALLLGTFSKLNLPRQWEWLAAVTSMGGLGVVSLLSGNVGNVLNLSVLAIALQAASGSAFALAMLPVAIGFGALIKPQFGIYIALLLCLDRSRTAAVIKAAATGAVVLAIHAIYAVARPHDWAEYTQAAFKRTVVEKDYAWGPAGLMKLFNDSNAAAFVAFLVGLAIVAALAFVLWRKSSANGRRVPEIALVGLAFMVLTFANPRMPPYDLFAACVALSVCCTFAIRTSSLAWVLVAVLAVNLVPWTIANFARTPAAFPWWMQTTQITHVLGFAGLLIALARTGLRSAGDREAIS